MGSKREWIQRETISGRIQEGNEWNNQKEADRDKKASHKH